MTALFQRFIANDSGATAIEYGLIAALMAVAAITAFMLLGSSIGGMFGWVRDQAGTAMDDAGV